MSKVHSTATWEQNKEALSLPGKAAMCTKIAANFSEKHQAYGDIEAGIESIELFDIKPGYVLTINPGESRNQNGFGPWKRLPNEDRSNKTAKAINGTKPNQQPQTKMVPFETLAKETDLLVVRVYASALNYPDLTMPTHVYQTRPDPPFCLGYEGSGEVIAVGPDASYDGNRGYFEKPKIGDRVFISPRINSHSSRIAIPAADCTPIPDTFDYDDAAGYVQGVVSSYNALIDRLDIKKDEWVLITGSTGAIGLAGVQICKKIGAKVIALGSDMKKTGRLDIVKQMGADHIINYVENPTWKDEVKRITGGKGAHCAYDVIGGDAFTQCVRAVRVGGRICVGGFATGIFPKLAMNLVLVKALYVCALTSQYPPNLEAKSKKRERLLQWAQDESLKPYISHRFKLSEVKEALKTMNERQQVGRIVLHCQEFD